MIKHARGIQLALGIVLVAGYLLFPQTSFPVSAASTTAATQWGIVDYTFTTSVKHTWYDFPLTATFTHSTGLTIRVDGFYNGQDGNGRYIWAIRFAPTLPGTWQWSTTATDSSLRASGSLQAVAPTTGQISANPNLRGHIRVQNSGARPGRYFVYADDTPFFWLGDTVWHLNTLRAGVGGGPYNNQNFYVWLNDRKAKGFTVAQLNFYERELRNEAGYPFPDNTTHTASQPGGNGNYANLSAEYFQFMDIRMNALFQNGFVVAALPTWLSEQKMSLTDTERISRYLMARYGAYNLVWGLSGEYQYKYPGTNIWDDADTGGAWNPCWNYASNQANPDCQWNRLGAAVAGYNSYHHPISVHPSGRRVNDPPEWGASAQQQSSGGEFHASSWLDHNWLQTGHADTLLQYVYKRVVENYVKSSSKPVVHSEGFYENHKADGADAYEVRWQAWVAFLNGAAGHVYGADGVWQFYDPAAPSGEAGRPSYSGANWQSALGYPGSTHLTYLSHFLTSIEWWRLEPTRGSLLLNNSQPYLPSSSDISPPHAAAIQNELYVVYIPRKNAGRSIRMTNLGTGAYAVQAFNPRTGAYISLNGGDPVSLTNGEWTVPSSVYSDNEDWVIKITSRPLAPSPTATRTLSPTSTATPTATASPRPSETATSTPTATATAQVPESGAGSGAFNVKINFQPETAPVPAGYLLDNGAVYADRGNGFRYGWNVDATKSTRDRNTASSPDQRYDTLIHMQLQGTFTWEIDVPNGTYTVHVVAGDPSYFNSLYRLNVEGTLTVDGTPSPTTPWIEGLTQVSVTDGRLTISSAPGAINNKLAFVEISSVP